MHVRPLTRPPRPADQTGFWVAVQLVLLGEQVWELWRGLELVLGKAAEQA